MDASVFTYILRYSRREQMVLILLSLVALPFVYLALDVPKRIINDAIGGDAVPEAVLGFAITQVDYLFMLCSLFLGLVLINGGFKYVINVYRGVVAERVLRQLRMDLFRNLMRFPLPTLKRRSSNEITAMVVAETEPVGGFVADAITVPVYQGGMLVTYVGFIFAQDVWLGAAALSFTPIQLILIPKLQAKVNRLGKQRVSAAREMADVLGESVSGAVDIHATGALAQRRDKLDDILQRLFDIRRQLYVRKFFIKFFNNFIGLIVPFFFFLIGGYFAIRGELSLGALVAVLAAYKDFSTPWRELIKYYQRKEDVRVKYEGLYQQFQQLTLYPAALIEGGGDHDAPLAYIEGSHVTLKDGRNTALDAVNFTIDTHRHTALIAKGDGAHELAQLLARLLFPTGGKLSADGVDLTRLTQRTVADRVSYVGAGSTVFKGAIADNLMLGHRHDVWSEPHRHTVRRILAALELRREIDEFGLARPVASLPDDIVDRILAARRALRDTLGASPTLRQLVLPFEPDVYNINCSVAENLLFGTPIDPKFEPDRLVDNRLVLDMLNETGLAHDLMQAGLDTAQQLVELLADVDPGDPLFMRFNLVTETELNDLSRLIGELGAGGLDQLSQDRRQSLLGLSLRLTVSRHRLDVITEARQQCILAVRRRLRDALGDLNPHIAFYDPNQVSPALSLRDNILFGRPASQHGRTAQDLPPLLRAGITAAGLDDVVTDHGLAQEIGNAGAPLNASQQQRLVLARALLRDNELLVVDQPLTHVDPDQRKRILEAVRQLRAQRGLVWVFDRPEDSEGFDQRLRVSGGRVEAL